MGVIKATFSQGYCLNDECEEFSKGVFLSGCATIYFCHRCKEPGTAEIEKHWPDWYDSLDFSQVRLEFNFYAPEGRYLGLCIVTDTSCEKVGNIWNVQSPNIKTEKLANKTATDVLAYLQRADQSIFEPGIIVRNTEIILELDVSKDKFKVELNNLENTLRRSRLAKPGPYGRIMKGIKE
jgi:hypothetical protein